jgi:hypothetical protein
MLKRDAEIRLSLEAQEEFEKCTAEPALFVESFNKIQQKVVQEFGFSDINVLQSAQSRFPNDPQICSTFYIKQNKCQDGALKIGDRVPSDITLYNLNRQSVKLTDFCDELPASEEKTIRPALVVLAGSLT